MRSSKGGKVLSKSAMFNTLYSTTTLDLDTALDSDLGFSLHASGLTYYRLDLFEESFAIE